MALRLLRGLRRLERVSVIWSIEGDRSWAYFNRGLVYLALAVVGLWLVPYVREWAYVLAGALALPLGWALLGKAIPALGSSGRIARLSSPSATGTRSRLLFAMAVPLALWLAAGGSTPTGCGRPESCTSTGWSSGCC